MELFIFKSEVEIKVIMVLIFWGIRWFYSHLTISNGTTPNEQPDKDADNSPIITIPITRKIEHIPPQGALLRQIVAAHPQSSQLAVIKDRKSSFGRKRKLFRNALLIDALMQRKYFIT